MNKNKATINGRGIIGDGPYMYREGKAGGNKRTWLGNKWVHKVNACRPDGPDPNYRDCILIEPWYHFQTFGKDVMKKANEMIILGNRLEDLELDKDLKIKGNRIYSPETCLVIPTELNYIAKRTNRARRGKYPIGVIAIADGLFEARICKNGTKNKIRLGHFKTPKEAFYAYKIEREAYIKELAEKWRTKITDEIYDAIIKYTIDIND